MLRSDWKVSRDEVLGQFGCFLWPRAANAEGGLCAARGASVITGEMEKTWPAAAWRDSGWSGGVQRMARKGDEGSVGRDGWLGGRELFIRTGNSRSDADLAVRTLLGPIWLSPS